MPKRNYHTHTTRCKHANGTDEQYVLAALEGGFDTLGFADHAPWPFANGYVSGIRMAAEQWPDYRDSILALKKKYAGQIDVRLGLESEYFPRYRDHMLRLRDEGCEYFILGQHFVSSEEDNPYIGQECVTDVGVRRYADSIAEGMATGLFRYVAHPDLYLRPRPEFDKVCMAAADIIGQAAKENGCTLEYNLLGLQSELQGQPRGYPNADFWQYIRKWEVPVILGVDAHSPAQLTDPVPWNTAVARLEQMKLRVISQL